MKKIINLLLSLTMLLSCIGITAKAEDNVTIYINDNMLYSEQPAIIANDRTLIPLRAIAEALGCIVEWAEDSKTVFIRNEFAQVDMAINSYTLFKTDVTNPTISESVELDVPPILYNDTTYVPARALAEAFSAVVDWNGEQRRVDITLEYDYVDIIWYDGFAKAVKDGKCGLINDKREIVIPLEYDYLFIDPEGYVRVWNGTIEAGDIRYGLLNTDGDILLPVTYRAIGTVCGDICTVADETFVWGAVNLNNEQVIDFKYDESFEFFDDMAIVVVDGEYGVIDRDEKEIIPFGEYDYMEFSENTSKTLFVVSKRDKYGIINADNDVIIDMKYEDIENINDTYVKVCESGLYGIIDIDGNVVIDADYESVGFLGGELFGAKKDGKWAVLDINSKEIIPYTYEAISELYEGRIWVMLNNKWGVVTEDGTVIFEPKYDTVFAYFNEYGLAPVMRDGKCGYVNTEGVEIIPCEYDDVYAFEGNIVKVEKDGERLYFNEKGERTNAVGELIN